MLRRRRAEEERRERERRAREAAARARRNSLGIPGLRGSGVGRAGFAAGSGVRRSTFSGGSGVARSGWCRVRGGRQRRSRGLVVEILGVIAGEASE